MKAASMAAACLILLAVCSTTSAAWTYTGTVQVEVVAPATTFYYGPYVSWSVPGPVIVPAPAIRPAPVIVRPAPVVVYPAPVPIRRWHRVRVW
jgi:hypothetical protein